MKIYKRKNSPNWYLRQGDTLISLKTTRKGQALQLLEEHLAKRLGIYQVPHKKASAFFESYLEHCRKYNKDTTIEDKKRTLNFFKEQSRDPWLRQLSKKTVESYLHSRKSKRSKVPISAERFNSERQILSNFFSYLIGQKALKENPAVAKSKMNPQGIERKSSAIRNPRASRVRQSKRLTNGLPTTIPSFCARRLRRSALD